MVTPDVTSYYVGGINLFALFKMTDSKKLCKFLPAKLVSFSTMKTTDKSFHFMKLTTQKLKLSIEDVFN